MIFTAAVIAVIAAISVIILVPRISSPVSPSVLLDETVTLSDEFYEKEYYLQLAKGIKINVKVDGHGQPVDFRITDPNGMIVNNVDITEIYTYEEQLTIPIEGTYTFYLGASTGNPRVRLTITKP